MRGGCLQPVMDPVHQYSAHQRPERPDQSHHTPVSRHGHGAPLGRRQGGKQTELRERHHGENKSPEKTRDREHQHDLVHLKMRKKRKRH